MDIEVEVRSFVSEAKFDELRKFFERNAEFLGEDEQQTAYFDCKEDIRLQRNSLCSKIWMKQGRMHDEAREETEIRLNRDDFDKALKILCSLGLKVAVVWLRKRLSYKWGEVNVALDSNRGYGLIVELEKMACDADKEQAREHLTKKMAEIGVEPTPRNVFDERLEHYKKSWRELLGNDAEIR